MRLSHCGVYLARFVLLFIPCAAVATEFEDQKSAPSGFRDLIETHRELAKEGKGYQGLLKELTEGVIKAEYLSCGASLSATNESGIVESSDNDVASAFVKMDIITITHRAKSQLVFKVSRRSIDKDGRLSGIAVDLTRIKNDFETADEAWKAIQGVFNDSVNLACRGQVDQGFIKAVTQGFVDYFRECKQEPKPCLRESFRKTLIKVPIVGVRG